MARHRQSGWSTFAIVVLATALAAPFLNPQTVLAQEPGTITTVAGTGGVSGYSGDGGPATDATLHNPAGIAYDASGNLLIADWGNHCIRMVAAISGTFFGQSMAAGYIYTIAGTGTGSYSGDGGTGTEATLRNPQGVAVDSSGNAFIADSANYCIRKVDGATGIITTVAGIGTSYGATGDEGPATAAKLNLPTGVAFDASGNLYIADSYNHRVRMIAAEDGTFYNQSMTAGYIYTIAGTGGWGYSGDGGSPTAATLTHPYSTHIDAAGNLYIADTDNHRVRMVPATTGTHYGVSMTAGNIYTVAGTGSAGFSGDGGLATSAELCWPSNMVIDSAGRMFIADRINRRVRAVDPDGVISTFAGTGDGGFSGDGGPATEANIGYLYNVALGGRGDVYIADTDNDCVREVFGDWAPWLTFLGGEAGEEGFAVAMDNCGNVYVAGYSYATWGDGEGVVSPNPVRAYTSGGDAFVAKLNSNGELLWNTFLGGSGWDIGRGLDLDEDGNVYVTGNSNASWETPVRPHQGYDDAFACKLNSDGELQWLTFLGSGGDGTGNGADYGYDIRAGADGSVYVAGESDFAWQGTSGPVRPHTAGDYDGFVAGLNSSGALQWNTFLGSSGQDEVWDITLDGGGNLCATGTSAASWQGTSTPVRTHSGSNDGFAAMLDSGGALQWNTFLGGSGNDRSYGIARGGDGNLLLTGFSGAAWQGDSVPVRSYSSGLDAFAAMLDSGGTLQWNTFLGGDSNDYGNGAAVDGSGNWYVAGTSESTWGSPLREFQGGYDAFAIKLNGSGDLQWSTFLGGSSYEYGNGVAADGAGYACVAGTNMATWGTPVRPYEGDYDAFAAQLDSDGNLEFDPTVDVDLDLQAGWNMISVPVTIGGNTVAEVFADIDPVAVYTWDPVEGAYDALSEDDFIEPERGYWLAVAAEDAGTLTLTGAPVSVDEWSASLSTGWNMVGTAWSATPIPLTDLRDGDSGALQDDTIYWWDTEHKTYELVLSDGNLVPGVGYWMACTADCTVTMAAP